MMNYNIKKFKKIYIEITNVCNLKCSFCPPTTRKAEFMSVSNFECILKKVKPHTNYLYLHIKGEPLLHSNLDQILKLCSEKGFKVCITTNGTLLNQSKILDILLNNSCVHKVHISLHSYEASQINLKFEEYILNIANLIKHSNFLIVLRLWNDGEGGLNKLNTQIIKILKNNFDFIRDDKINNNTYIETGNKFDWGDINNINNINLNNTGFCYGLRDQIGILVNGDVVPCCLDNNGDINLGNILKQDLQEIYNSDRAKNLYNGFSNRKRVEKLCQTCGFINRFN